MDRDKSSGTGVDVERRTLLKRCSAVALGALISDVASAAEPTKKEVVPAPNSELAKLQAELSWPLPGKEDHSCDPRVYFRELSNWGRWGKDDVLGTLNLITPAVRAAAAALVRDGISIGCAWKIEPRPIKGGVERFMAVLPDQMIGDGREGNGRHLSAVAEHLSMPTHGGWITHLDALSHAFWDGQMYNGFPANSVTATGGATKGEVAAVAAGIVSRGVLLDIAELLGVEALDAGYAVTPEQLEAAEKHQRVKVRTGDVVLLHTGCGRRVREAGGFLLPYHGMPGWHPRCLPWLHERGVSAVGSDAAQDPFPTGFAWSDHYLPFHDVGIIAMGLWLIDWCNLEELAQKCTELGRYEFQFVVAPLRLAGCTASPVHPIAIF